MKLMVISDDETRATLAIDGDRQVVVRCKDVRAMREIVRRVKLHDRLIQVLQVFSSTQGMGNGIVDAMVAFGEGDPRQELVEERARKLINVVDVIVKGEELSELR